MVLNNFHLSVVGLWGNFIPPPWIRPWHNIAASHKRVNLGVNSTLPLKHQRNFPDDFCHPFRVPPNEFQTWKPEVDAVRHSSNAKRNHSSGTVSNLPKGARWIDEMTRHCRVATLSWHPRHQIWNVAPLSLEARRNGPPSPISRQWGFCDRDRLVIDRGRGRGLGARGLVCKWYLPKSLPFSPFSSGLPCPPEEGLCPSSFMCLLRRIRAMILT